MKSVSGLSNSKAQDERGGRSKGVAIYTGTREICDMTSFGQPSATYCTVLTQNLRTCISMLTPFNSHLNQKTKIVLHSSPRLHFTSDPQRRFSGFVIPPKAHA